VRAQKGGTALKLPRRRFLRLAAGAAALPTMLRVARAQAYPSRPVRIVVGFAAGSSPDITARLMGQWLSARLGQQFIIDNRPGAGTNIGIEAVVRAPPDGYTLLWVTPSSAINATLYDKLNFNFIRDIAPVASIARLPNVMVINPSVPAKTVPEFINYAKANPGKINMGSAAIGGTDHMSGELFKIMAGADLVLVPYRGGGASLYSDLVGGQIQVSFPVTASSIGYIKGGKLRALAVTTASRWEGLPDLPTMGEFVPGYEASTWHGLGAPKATPVEIIDKLHDQINMALADPMMKTRLAELGGVVMRGSPADFGKFIAAETERWGKVIRAANIKAE
jgi:tripartite-type tricarboxylate transporter receptor subunit TctC